MPKYLLPLLLLIACTDPHYLDPVQPDPAPACQLNGTARYTAFNFTGANTTFRMGYGDTITAPVEVVTNSSYAWQVPAGRTRLYIWNKFIPGYGVYVMDVDTCQEFQCAVRVYNNEIYLNDKKIEIMKKEKLIEELSKLPDGVEVCVFDWRKNMYNDIGDGSGVGIYPDFEIELLDKKLMPAGVKPWAALSIINDDYNDDGTKQEY